jgi:uncharacterized protein YkwD
MKMNKLQQKIIYSVAITAIFFSCFSFALASEVNKNSIIQLVNQSRTENNVQVLNENEILDKVAQDKLDDMLKNNYFAHTSPAGITPWHWFDENKYDYRYAGENLALGFSSVENEHKAWMDSLTHKKNILNPNYKEIGVAVRKGTIDGSLVTVAVQEFGSRAENGVLEKEENNLSDDKSKELLEEDKEEKKGIVLNTENSDPNGKLNNLINNNKTGSKISFSNLKKFLSEEKDLFESPVWVALITVLTTCLMINLAAVLFIASHYLIIYLRKNQDMFKVVHGLLILFLIGSIIL